MVHETNFKESIKMLVIQDGQKEHDSDNSPHDSDTDAIAHRHLDHIREVSAVSNTNIEPLSNTMRKSAGTAQQLEQYKKNQARAEAAARGFTMVDMKAAKASDGAAAEDGDQGRETESLLKHQRHYANIAAARRFLTMGEQRGSAGGSKATSERSSVDPDADQYVPKYKEASESQNEKRDQRKEVKGLTAQVIKKNTLDKPEYGKRVPGPDAASATAGAIADDNESQNPQRSTIYTPFGGREAKDQSKYGDLEAQEDAEGSAMERYSHEFSQNVEVNSNRSSEIKYLFGEKLDAEVLATQQTGAGPKSVQEKERSIE